MPLLSIHRDGSSISGATPSVYEMTPNEIVKSSRNALGNLYKYRINVKTTIHVEWWAIASSTKDLIMWATAPNTFFVDYFDVTTSTMRSGTFYRGNDLKITPVTRYNGSDFEYFTISMTLVEV